MAVSENERKIDNLRKENDYQREQLHELQMHHDGEDKKALIPELNQLDNKITNLTKDLDKYKEINKKVQLVNDQVMGWGTKMM